jgi:poly(A) polymerase
MSDVQALIAAAAELSAGQNVRIAVPKRFSLPMREILQIQPRFDNRKGKRARSLLEHRRFRAAYDLMLLRVGLGEVDQETADWWTEVQELPEQQKKQQFGARRRSKKPRNRRKKKQ